MVSGDGTTIRIVDERGNEISQLTGYQRFRVEVTRPRTANPDRTITVDFDDDSMTGESVSMAWDQGTRGDTVRYVSNVLTLDKGGEGGAKLSLFGMLECSRGDLGPLKFSNGGTVTVKYGDQSAQVETFKTWVQLGLENTKRYLDSAEVFWRKILDGLGSMPSDPEVERLKRIAEDRLTIIDLGQDAVSKESWLDPQRLWVAQRCANAVTNLDQTARDFSTRIYSPSIGVGRRMAEDVMWHGIGQAAIGAYQVFASATGAGSVYTAFTGENVLGRKVSDLERWLSIVEVASQAALTAAGIARSLQSISRPTHAPMNIERRAGAELDHLDLPSGTVIDPAQFGMRPQALRHAQYVASEHGVVIQVRGTGVEAIRLRNLGHPPKPEAIKAKTINEVDVRLGAAPDGLGQVGYFEPKMPVRTADMPDGLWSQIEKRYAQRAQEYVDQSKKMGKLLDEGKIAIDRGVVIDTGLCGNTGKGITGDHDLFRITDLEGNPLGAEAKEFVVNDLRQGPFGAQHGAHTDWKPATPVDQGIYDAIINKHVEGGGDALIEIRGPGQGPARAAYSDVSTPARPPSPAPTNAGGVTGGGPLVGDGGLGAGVRAASGDADTATPDPEMERIKRFYDSLDSQSYGGDEETSDESSLPGMDEYRPEVPAALLDLTPLIETANAPEPPDRPWLGVCPRSLVAGGAGLLLGLGILGGAGMALAGGDGDADATTTQAASDITPTSLVANEPSPTTIVDDPTPAPPPFALSPIEAMSTEQVTEYVVSVDEPGPTTYAWSGATCGTAEADGNRYVWDHTGETITLSGGIFGNQTLSETGCDHEVFPGHEDATIQVIIDNPAFRATCIYVGTANGTGPECSWVRIQAGGQLPPPPPPLPTPEGGGSVPPSTRDPLDQAIAEAFAGGYPAPFVIDFSAGSCEQFAPAYRQGVSLQGDASRDTMTMYQGEHRPTGDYPSDHESTLATDYPVPEHYELEFFLDGDVLAFRGTYRYLDNCRWQITGHRQ